MSEEHCSLAETPGILVVLGHLMCFCPQNPILDCHAFLVGWRSGTQDKWIIYYNVKYGVWDCFEVVQKLNEIDRNGVYPKWEPPGLFHWKGTIWVAKYYQKFRMFREIWASYIVCLFFLFTGCFGGPLSQSHQVPTWHHCFQHFPPALWGHLLGVGDPSDAESLNLPCSNSMRWGGTSASSSSSSSSASPSPSSSSSSSSSKYPSKMGPRKLSDLFRPFQTTPPETRLFLDLVVQANGLPYESVWHRPRSASLTLLEKPEKRGHVDTKAMALHWRFYSFAKIMVRWEVRLFVCTILYSLDAWWMLAAYHRQDDRCTFHVISFHFISLHMMMMIIIIHHHHHHHHHHLPLHTFLRADGWMTVSLREPIWPGSAAAVPGGIVRGSPSQAEKHRKAIEKQREKTFQWPKHAEILSDWGPCHNFRLLKNSPFSWPPHNIF